MYVIPFKLSIIPLTIRNKGIKGIHQLTLLQSIPGIDVKTALFLIVLTDGFEEFETGSQLYSYAGIIPAI